MRLIDADAIRYGPLGNVYQEDIDAMPTIETEHIVTVKCEIDKEKLLKMMMEILKEEGIDIE